MIGEFKAQELSQEIEDQSSTLKSHDTRISKLERQWEGAISKAQHLLALLGAYAASGPIKNLGEFVGLIIKAAGKMP